METETLTTKLPESAVLDSSVVLKWFRKDEIWRASALQMRQAYLDGHMLIYVPDLLIYEIANVLRYKPDLTDQQAQEALDSLYDLNIKVIEISQEIIKGAVRLAYSYGITVYDAAFLVLAESLKVPFVTAHEKLSERLFGVPYAQHISLFA
jgi:predicted nucleic acid-binding protein